MPRRLRIDAAVLDALAALIPLAPLHQPHNLTPIRALLATAPDLPQVACFDTAFHRTMPELAQAYALPASVTDHGVRRYGFHGLSYEYIASVLPRHDAHAAAGRVVVAHLGNGASMCAMEAGRSIASTMGFTALEGLPMGTRSGSVDPGVLLYLMQERGMSAEAIQHLLYNESGLLGVSGLSSDMRTLLASDDARARFAVDLFVYRIGARARARWPRRSADSTPWCSPEASASTPRRSARGCSSRRAGSGSPAAPRRMPMTGRASRAPATHRRRG